MQRFRSQSSLCSVTTVGALHGKPASAGRPSSASAPPQLTAYASTPGKAAVFRDTATEHHAPFGQSDYLPSEKASAIPAVLAPLLARLLPRSSLCWVDPASLTRQPTAAYLAHPLAAARGVLRPPLLPPSPPVTCAIPPVCYPHPTPQNHPVGPHGCQCSPLGGSPTTPDKAQILGKALEPVRAQYARVAFVPWADVTRVRHDMHEAPFCAFEGNQMNPGGFCCDCTHVSASTDPGETLAHCCCCDWETHAQPIGVRGKLPATR